MLQFSDTKGLVLADTLCCGQCFRWQPVPGGWQGIVAGRAVLASQQPGGALMKFFVEFSLGFTIHIFLPPKAL